MTEKKETIDLVEEREKKPKKKLSNKEKDRKRKARIKEFDSVFGGRNKISGFQKLKQKKKRNVDTLQKENPIDIDLMLYSFIRKKDRKRLIKELICYIPFMVIVVVYLSFSTFITEAFWMNDGLKDLILSEEFPTGPDLKIYKAFSDIGSYGEFWEWVEGPLTAAIFNEGGYNGKPLRTDQLRYAQTHNKFFGALRIRQLRVRNDTCTNILKELGIDEEKHKGSTKHFDMNCYGEYPSSSIWLPWTLASSPSVLDLEPFGPNQMFKFKKEREIGGGSEFGYYGTKGWYTDIDGHGEELNIASSEAEAVAFFGNLKLNHWLNAQTRAVFIELYSYNPNLNYFTSIKCVVEFTAGGGVIPSWDFRIFKMEVLRSAREYIQFGICGLLPIYVAFYIYQYFQEFYLAWVGSEVVGFFLSPWNVLDFLNYVFFLWSFIMRGFWWVDVDRTAFQITTKTYPTLDNVVWLYVYDIYFTSINTVITFFKIFKFFSIVERFNLLINTISKASSNLFSTGLILVIFLGSFAASGWILFGFDIEGFRDLNVALVSLLRLLLGDFDYVGLRQENRQLAAAYYGIFTVIGAFVVLNMFLAVISSSFESVSEEVKTDDDISYEQIKQQAFEITEDVKTKLYSIWEELFLDFVLDTIISPITSKGIGEEKKPTKLKTENDEQSLNLIKYDHGDKEIVEILSEYQAKKDNAELTIDDLKQALGSEADFILIQRIMRRFDKDGDGTIDPDELDLLNSEEEDEEDLENSEENERREKEKQDRLRQISKQSLHGQIDKSLDPDAREELLQNYRKTKKTKILEEERDFKVLSKKVIVMETKLDKIEKYLRVIYG